MKDDQQCTSGAEENQSINMDEDDDQMKDDQQCTSGAEENQSINMDEDDDQMKDDQQCTSGAEENQSINMDEDDEQMKDDQQCTSGAEENQSINMDEDDDQMKDDQQCTSGAEENQSINMDEDDDQMKDDQQCTSGAEENQSINMDEDDEQMKDDQQCTSGAEENQSINMDEDDEQMKDDQQCTSGAEENQSINMDEDDDQTSSSGDSSDSSESEYEPGSDDSASGYSSPAERAHCSRRNNQAVTGASKNASSTSSSESEHEPSVYSDDEQYSPSSELPHCSRNSPMEEETEYSNTTNKKEKITVLSTNNENGKRNFDKKYPCFFCPTKTTQIQRHFRDLHPDEEEVQAIVNEKDKKEKSKKMTLLRNRGIHKHNSSVLRQGHGTLIVAYRPTFDTSHANYGPCDHCLGYFVRSDLWKHSCELRPKSYKKNHQERRAVTCKYLLPLEKGLSADLQSITSGMAKDQISRVAKSDPLIINLAERQYASLGHDKDQQCSIRTKMRESARLLIELRKATKDPDAAMENFIDPKHFRVVVAAVQKVSGYDDTTHQYNTPSLALKLGHTLKKMTLVMCGRAAEKGDNEAYIRAQRFGERCSSDWSVFVSSNALRTIQQNHRNKTKLLPLVEDVAALTNLLKERGRHCFNWVKKYRSTRASVEDKDQAKDEGKDEANELWCELSEITLTQAMMFNRRRQGEISKLKMSDMKKVDLVQRDPAIMKSLSCLEQQLCNQLARVEVVGKRGRSVPVLLTMEMRDWINLLMETRQEIASVHPENDFVFARSYFGSKGHIRGSDCIRKFAHLCGAKHPSRLTGTNLRKQLATMCQVLNLKENEMDIVASYLGHDIRVHRQYYRLPMEILQVAKVSKLLIAMEKGGDGLAKGQNLDDIPVCEEELEESENEETEADAQSSEPAGNLVQDLNKAKERKTPKKHTTKTVSRKKKVTKHRPWTPEERQAVKRNLHHLLVLNTLPGKADIERCIAKEPALHSRTWRNIKDFCRNMMKSMEP
ncbi:hypothetical protein HOLleu_02461 [Holothuria leucospilota]|uniref:Uncharacterized protein n=1 Tax=Holothuria leucospilota TaxID=206669 RepID=A0A9Q1CRB8_HOLLE|nr:hypothetical protein HOLleu_02461 [Holothuria leucospilota]